MIRWLVAALLCCCCAASALAQTANDRQMAQCQQHRDAADRNKWQPGFDGKTPQAGQALVDCGAIERQFLAEHAMTPPSLAPAPTTPAAPAAADAPDIRGEGRAALAYKLNLCHRHATWQTYTAPLFKDGPMRTRGRRTGWQPGFESCDDIQKQFEAAQGPSAPPAPDDTATRDLAIINGE